MTGLATTPSLPPSTGDAAAPPGLPGSRAAPAFALGVPLLDAQLAPLAPGGSVLLLNDPGVEAEPFVYQAARGHLAEGRHVVYVTLHRAPSQVRQDMLDCGLAAGDDASTGGAALHFVDGYSHLLGQHEDVAYPVVDPHNLDQLAVTVERALHDHPGAVLLVDALSSVLDHAPPEAFASFVHRLHRSAARAHLTIALFTSWPYNPDAASALQDFAGVVRLRGVEDRVQVGQFFALERGPDASEEARRPRLYRVLRPGGVVVYLPKLLVTGPAHAGKSTFIRNAADAATSADRMSTTVAMDHGRLTLDGVTAELFGTPGQARFDPLLDMLSGQAVGVVLMVDATRPDTFPRAREMLLRTWREALPAVVVANKLDLPGALPPEEVARRLHPPAGVPVVGCQARDPAAARELVRTFFDRILHAPPLEVAP